jgi:hypothetical protein
LQKPQENYWFEYIPDYRAIYLQYNRSQETPGGMSMNQFTEGLIRTIEQRKPEALILDLRFNTGGNLLVGTPLIRAVAEKSGKVPLFVITGRATFSAGISAVVQLKQWANATIIGEPVGDELDFWAEGGNLITLPNSGLVAHYSNGFHNYSRREYPARTPYLKSAVDSVQPEVSIEPSWSDYIEGKDPVLNAVAERLHIARP